MKLIPKPIVKPQIFRLLIWILITSLFHHLLLSCIIDHGICTGIIRMPHEHLLRVLGDIASIKLF